MFELELQFDPTHSFYDALFGIKLNTPKQMNTAVKQIMVFLIDRVKDRIRIQFKQKTGRMMSSWGYQEPVTSNGVTKGVFGSSVYYSKHHEFGKTVSRNKPYSIPLTPLRNITPAHNLDRKKTFISPHGVIFLKTGAKFSTKYTGQAGLKGRYIPLYILRNKFRIPARPFLRPTLDAHLGPLANILKKSLEAIVTQK